jgi:Xaa-Pro aminopeptidase
MATLNGSGPKLSIRERDRRYAAVRERLKERGIDCAVVMGSNLFYLTNGLAGERFAVLPANDEPISVTIHTRHLIDLSPQVLIDSQEWVNDVRAAFDASGTIERIKELHLEQGTIGLSDSTGAVGGLSHGFFTQMQSALPNAQLVDITDIFLDIRTIKSEEEIALIERANILFDLAVERIHQVARPGMTGAQVIQEGIKAAWEAGGDLDSTMGFNFGPVPKQNPILGAICLDRQIQPGDIGTLTAHTEYHHYAGHSDQEISFGEPSAMHKQMFAAVLHVREQVLKHVRAGVTQNDLVAVYDQACKETGFRSSIHSQMHQYGIDVPEFPGPSFNVTPPPGAKRERRSNFTLQAGMVYSISPTLVAENGEDTLLGGTSLVVTQDGYRELGDRKVEFLVVS